MFRQCVAVGLIAPYSILFGGGVRRHLNEDYNEARQSFGIITSLPEGSPPSPPPKKARDRSPSKASARASAAEVKGILDALTQMTDAFCEEFLDDEYAQLCRRLAEKLARKRPSPLVQGHLETWASGIVRTIGWVNFLHDPSQTPHMKLSSIDEAFGVAESTGAAKLKAIRTTFKIDQLDPAWTLPSKMEDNLMVWMLNVNGFVIDIRHAPREAQVVAFEKGLIPYIPADRPRTEE